MIQVSMSSAFMVYLLIPFFAILLLWVLSEYKTRTKSTHVEMDRSMQCSVCLSTYLYQQNESISKCPVCGSYNDVSLE